MIDNFVINVIIIMIDNYNITIVVISITKFSVIGFLCTYFTHYQLAV